MSKSTDWIKLRKILRRDGRVMLMARKCNTLRVTIIGALCDMWMLADDYADDSGVLWGWSAELINKEVEIENFCESLPSEWFEFGDDFVKFPEYLEHNGSTAKKRAASGKRQKRHRVSKKECNAASVTPSKSISISNSLNINKNSQLQCLDEISRDMLRVDYSDECISHYEILAANSLSSRGEQRSDFGAYVKVFILRDQAKNDGWFKPDESKKLHPIDQMVADMNSPEEYPELVLDLEDY